MISNFRAGKDGEGRVRFFIDGGEHMLDEYVAKYVKHFGVMPDIPVGLGGRGAGEQERMAADEAIMKKQRELDAAKQNEESLAARLKTAEAKIAELEDDGA